MPDVRQKILHIQFVFIGDVSEGYVLFGFCANRMVDGFGRGEGKEYNAVLYSLRKLSYGGAFCADVESYRID